MKIEIKNLKFSDFASEETHCFEATVYVDGKRSFIASNDGHGGCNNYYPLKAVAGEQNKVWARVKEIDAELAKLPPVVTDIQNEDGTWFTYHKDIDAVISDLVEDALLLKEAKRILKRTTYTKGDGKIYQLASKFKPTTDTFAAVRRAKWWSPQYTILNEYPVEEMVKFLKAA